MTASECKNKERHLARYLAGWIGSFFLIAAVLQMLWISSMIRKESQRELLRLATTNAEFVSGLRLPYSPQLASQLAEILDLGVGFYFGNKPSQQWPESLRSRIENLAKTGQPKVFSAKNSEVALAPLRDETKGAAFLVLIREKSFFSQGGGTLGSRLILPTCILAIGCAGLAFGLGRSIVRPLTVLTQWLPALRGEGGRGSRQEEIPASISARRDEVGTLARALQTVRTELEQEKSLRAQSEKLAALGRVASSLAHEVKNPAAAIRLHAEILRSRLNGVDENAESIDLIQEEVDQITDLVNQWLYFSQSSPPAMSRHDLVTVVEEVTARMTATMEFHQVEWVLSKPDGPLWIHCDRMRFQQALRNLLQNGIDAMPEPGGVLRIDFSVEDEGSQVLLRVSDSGPGFSEQARLRFGEPFFSEKEGGMGIGLTLARDVVRAHGGELTLESSVADRGGTVALRFPLDREETKLDGNC